MHNARIFLVSDAKDNLIPMIETEYEKEDILQSYLARYPDLLPGEQFDPENPRRWLLVAREMGVPGDADKTNRWSLDHLFLDQDGIPTFVECKRSSDTRARREVVAQMLDYAANGLEYWSVDRLRQDATEVARSMGRSIEDEVGTLINNHDTDAVEDFWRNVEENLKSGKVRLVFVTDETTKELRRLVEFLNEKMDDVEVLAVEIKQFLGGGKTTLVPRTIGLTEASRGKKPPRPEPIASSEQFLKQQSSNVREKMKLLLARMQDIADASNGLFEVGYGGATANLYWLADDGRKLRFFALESRGGRATVWLDYIRKAGHQPIATKLEGLASPIIPGLLGKPSGAIEVQNADFDRLLELITNLAKTIATEAGAIRNQ